MDQTIHDIWSRYLNS